MVQIGEAPWRLFFYEEMDALLEGLRELPTPAKHGAGRAGRLFPKCAQRSEQLCGLMRERKAAIALERKEKEAKSRNRATNQAWNNDRSRVGDFVGDDDNPTDPKGVDGRRAHPNFHPPQAVLRNA